MLCYFFKPPQTQERKNARTQERKNARTQESNIFFNLKCKTFIFILAILSIYFSLSAKAEDCTSNAIKGISAVPLDENSCEFEFTAEIQFGYIIKSYYWTFGDDQYGYSSDIQPTYKYSDGNTFNVCVTIVDQNDCTQTFCIDVYTGDCPGGFCRPISIDKCCAFVCVDEYEGWTWELDFGDGNIISYLEGEDVSSQHCYNDIGSFNISITYFDEDDNIVSIYERQIIITDASCGNPPVHRNYFLCFEDYYGNFGCVKSITYKDLNGIEIEYLFPNGPVTNTSYGVNLLISEMADFAQNHLNGVKYSNVQIDVQECTKDDNDPNTPPNPAYLIGHFLLDCPYEILRFNASPDNVQCMPSSCPITPLCQQSPNAGAPYVNFFVD